MKILMVLFVVFSGIFPKTPDAVQIPVPAAFQSGEILKYRLHYGMIDGGIALLNVEEKIIDGQKVFHAKAYAKTAGVADRLFKVKDVYECYMDAASCKPIKSVRSVSEGNYKLYNEVVYEHENKKAISQRTGEHIVPENIQDFVSSFYYARNSLFKNLKPNQILSINTFFDDKIYPLKIRYIGSETIDCSFGKINCLKFSPEVEPGRVFSSKNDLAVWISNDENLIPVRVQMNLMIGSVKCDLTAYEGLKSKLKTVD